MAKDYRRKNSARPSGGASKQLLLVLVSFLFGYLSASIFDFTNLSSWVNTHVLAQQIVPSAKNTAQQAQLPKPKFEFYTLLASERTDTTAQPVAAPAMALPTKQPLPLNVPVLKNQPVVALQPAIPATAPATRPAATPIAVAENKGAYLVQIASFKSQQEAERMKATLAIKGFNVNVAVVTQQQIQWYRVVLGPFSSRMQAEQAKSSIAQREHIIGMIRKMDA